MNIGDDDEAPIDDATVVERASAVLRRNAQTPVLVKADETVPYGRVVTGAVLLQQAGAHEDRFPDGPGRHGSRRREAAERERAMSIHPPAQGSRRVVGRAARRRRRRPLHVGLPWPAAAARAVPTRRRSRASIVDQSARSSASSKRREEAARKSAQRQQREERQRARSGGASSARRSSAQEQRVAASSERDEREAREKADAARSASEREAQAARGAPRSARRKRERGRKREQARARAEARSRAAAAQAESELQQQLALEAEQNAARAAGLHDQYIRVIERQDQAQLEPPAERAARARLRRDRRASCRRGDVVSAKVDELQRRRRGAPLDRARGLDASPLPKPPTPALFERNLNVTFRPERVSGRSCFAKRPVWES